VCGRPVMQVEALQRRLTCVPAAGHQLITSALILSCSRPHHRRCAVGAQGRAKRCSGSVMRRAA
jgi:hypothetical protein